MSRRRLWRRFRVAYLPAALAFVVWIVLARDSSSLVAVGATPLIAASAYFDWRAQRQQTQAPHR